MPKDTVNGTLPSKVNTLKSKVPDKTPVNVNLNKYRRLQTLQKKCAEISHQCDVDIVMIIRDRKFNRFKEYHTSKAITADHIADMMARTRNTKKAPRYQKVLISYDTEQAGDANSLCDEARSHPNQQSSSPAEQSAATPPKDQLVEASQKLDVPIQSLRISQKLKSMVGKKRRHEDVALDQPVVQPPILDSARVLDSSETIEPTPPSDVAPEELFDQTANLPQMDQAATKATTKYEPPFLMNSLCKLFSSPRHRLIAENTQKRIAAKLQERAMETNAQPSAFRAAPPSKPIIVPIVKGAAQKPQVQPQQPGDEAPATYDYLRNSQGQPMSKMQLLIWQHLQKTACD